MPPQGVRAFALRAQSVLKDSAAEYHVPKEIKSMSDESIRMERRAAI